MKYNPTKHFAAPKEGRYTLNGRGLLTYRRGELRRFASRLGVRTDTDKQDMVKAIETILMLKGVEPGEISKALGEGPAKGPARSTVLLDEEDRERHEQELAEASGVPEVSDREVDEFKASREDTRGFDPFEKLEEEDDDAAR